MSSRNGATTSTSAVAGYGEKRRRHANGTTAADSMNSGNRKAIPLPSS